ncbi:MAG: 4-hydroxythreonine-4-phosphate dehydrogenase PdxA [Muribaculaceae bacterium]|nr:4-hydroxythreonine-4-phosphate dehydrogenase PdxA [Muribaculaceae bacterium]
MSNERKIRIGITQGDTNGVGYEVIMKCFTSNDILELCTPIVYGSSKIMNYHRKALGIQTTQLNITRNAGYVKENQLNLVEVINEEVKIELGQPGKQAGNAAFMALEAAVSDLKKGVIDVLVTAPINKDNIHSEEFSFPGHTEYLETSLGDGAKALMVLCNDKIRVALVTTHIPIAKVAQSINKEDIVEKLRIFNDSLQRDFNIQKPRIAVLGLNPHCGDNGVIGTEEKEIIEPAIQEANDNQILCFGPYPADGFFGSNQYLRFDGVLAMYHDQGLAPFKTIAMNDGVNVTAGLPYVRTSPDHGTGYDIVGQGIASDLSMRHAIYTAIDIYRNRKNWDEMYQNPLKKQYFDKGKDNVVLDLTKIEDEEPLG